MSGLQVVRNARSLSQKAKQGRQVSRATQSVDVCLFFLFQLQFLHNPVQIPLVSQLIDLIQFNQTRYVVNVAAARDLSIDVHCHLCHCLNINQVNLHNRQQWTSSNELMQYNEQITYLLWF